MSPARTPQPAGPFNTLGRRLGAAFPVLCLAAVVILAGPLSTPSRAAPIAVPNGDFETLYKPGTAIAGNVEGTGWSQGVGPDCPIDTGNYVFDGATTGDVADIAGWLGYDRQGWWDNGGTYGRVDYYPGDPGPPEVPPDPNIPDPLHPDRFGNLQGSISSQFNHTDGGRQCYLSNGGGWGNAAGGLIVSDAPLATVQSGLIYTLSMMANGRDGGPGATPFVLDLLADGVALTPSSSVQPVLADNVWMEVSRTYDLASLADSVGKDLTIVLGVDRGCGGSQTQFDDVTLDAIPEPTTLALLARGAFAMIRRRRHGR